MATTAASQTKTVTVSNLSNKEFLDRYAAAGCVGLSGGTTLVDRAICRAERHLDAEAVWSCWSHAFFFEGRRSDGQHWVIESDLDIHRRHIRLGVQENRVDKYYDDQLYSCLAVLDFRLAENQVNELLSTALDLVANRERYSLRELVGTLVALRHPQLRTRANVLGRERSMFCSAFVEHIFRRTGLELTPGVDRKNTTPEDIARTPRPHTAYILHRAVLSQSIRQKTRLES